MDGRWLEIEKLRNIGSDAEKFDSFVNSIMKEFEEKILRPLCLF